MVQKGDDVRGRVNRVALFGAVLGLGALLATPWLNIRPNRLSSGTGVYALLDDPAAFALLASVWIVCLAVAARRGIEIRGWMLAGCGGLAAVLTPILAASSARTLLLDAQPFARVSLSVGTWASFVAAYAVLYAAAQEITAGKLQRTAAVWAGPFLLVLLGMGGAFEGLSLSAEFAVKSARFTQELLRHLQLAGIGLGAGTLIGVPLGIWSARRKRVAGLILPTVGLFQTVPSLALLGLLIAPLAALSQAVPLLRDLGIRGIGTAPAVIALTVYALLPLVRNTYTAILEVDPATIDAGLGMGMSRSQLLRRVELPLALPLIVEGVRTASVLLIGITAVTDLIGAGGLGNFIFEGINQAAPDLTLLGAIPVIILALAADALLHAAARIVRPRGARSEVATA